MRHKLVFKLIRNYSVLLMLFAATILILFFVLLNQQAVTLKKTHIQEQGQKIAQSLMDVDKEKAQGIHGKKGYKRGYQSYLNLINEMSQEKIWIVDTVGKTLISSAPNHTMQTKTTPLTTEAKLGLDTSVQTRKSVFFDVGETTNQDAMIFVVPLKKESEDIYGAVILETSTKNLLAQNQADFTLLFVVTGVTLVLTILLSVYLARRFVQPIYKMVAFTDYLIEEKYDERLILDTKDELSHLSHKLTVLSQRLAHAKTEQLNKEVSQQLFLSQISHELRTPVMIIKNSLERLQQRNQLGLTEEKQLSNLFQEVEQLERLMNDLLELTRLQSTEFSINCETVSVLDILDDSLRSFKPILEQRGCVISKEIYLETHPMIEGDYLRLVQLIKIMLDNASKYGEKSVPITLRVEEKHNIVCLSVRNKSLEPIHQEVMDDYFEAFIQGDSSADGHGLGLTIAKQIVKRHSGKIHIVVEDNDYVNIKVSFSTLVRI